MATITPVRIDHGNHYVGADLYEWSPVSAGDTVGWLVLPPKADKTVHVYAAGAFGGAVTFEGTLETPDSGTPAHPFTINDSRGLTNPLSFTAEPASGAEVMEHCIQIRPKPGAGVANVTVRLLAVRPM